MPTRSREKTPTTIYKVSEINRLARSTLENQFSGIWVEGEISELLQHRSGHWYFTLKDKDAQLRVAMFRRANSGVRFKPANGQQIVLEGQLSIYEARGSYQFIAAKMKLAGEGQLQREFELLKQKLAAEGLFSEQYKKPLPALPKQIAVVTSPQGAALKDILTVFKRRHAGIELVVVPVAVQGAGAAEQIANAVNQLNALASPSGNKKNFHASMASFRPDAIIVGRGGGSLEDLWAFNEEIVARAIFASRIPVVSAVGHETDFSIADFVADVRAATPSAAAELLSPDSQYMHKQLDALLRRATNHTLQRITSNRLALVNTANRLEHPAARLTQYAMSLDHLDTRLRALQDKNLQNTRNRLVYQAHRLRSLAPIARISSLRSRLGDRGNQLKNLIDKRLNNAASQFERSAVALNIVSPLATLDRGYSITYNNRGEILHSIEQVSSNEKIRTRLRDGIILARIESTETNDKTTDKTTKQPGHPTNRQ